MERKPCKFQIGDEVRSTTLTVYQGVVTNIRRSSWFPEYWRVSVAADNKLGDRHFYDDHLEFVDEFTNVVRTIREEAGL